MKRKKLNRQLQSVVERRFAAYSIAAGAVAAATSVSHAAIVHQNPGDISLKAPVSTTQGQINTVSLPWDVDMNGSPDFSLNHKDGVAQIPFSYGAYSQHFTRASIRAIGQGGLVAQQGAGFVAANLVNYGEIIDQNDNFREIGRLWSVASYPNSASNTNVPPAGSFYGQSNALLGVRFLIPYAQQCV